MKRVFPIVALVTAMFLAKTSRAVSLEEFATRVPDSMVGSFFVVLPVHVRDWMSDAVQGLAGVISADCTNGHPLPMLIQPQTCVNAYLLDLAT